MGQGLRHEYRLIACTIGCFNVTSEECFVHSIEVCTGDKFGFGYAHIAGLSRNKDENSSA